MALVILQPNATSSKFLGSGSDVDNVFGATGNETVWIDANGKVVLDPSFSAGGDKININGNAGDYQARVSGSNIVFTNAAGASITIPAGAAGVDVTFNDGVRELVIMGGGLHLGDQMIPTDGTLVDVEPGNRAPVFSEDEVEITTGQGDAFSDSLVGAAVDPDGDSLTYSLASQAANGTVVVNANGTYTYTPNASFVGNDSYVVRVTDSSGLTDELVVRVVVTPDSEPGPTGLRLSSFADDIIGTSGDDLIRARVSQNAAGTGEQANELGTGDFIDGRGGVDRLDAWIQGATPVGGAVGSTSIAPETTSVEIIDFRAVKVAGSLANIDPEDLPALFFGELGPRLGVQVDASDMFGVEEIGSKQSDESLTIYDLTTLNNDGVTFRATAEMTIRMDHTGNNTAIGAESDLTVLFDRDYLICENQIPTGGQLFIEMMDLDAAILLQNGINTYPAGRSNAGLPIEGPLDDSPYGRVNFTLGGVERFINFGTDYDTYPELLAAIQTAIAGIPALNGSQPGGANIVASLGPSFTANDTDSDPGGSATGTTIVLTNIGNSDAFDDVTFVATQTVPGEKDYHLQPYTDPPEGVDCVIEVDVVLNKVGRGGDGGELTIGGMVPNLDNVWDKESESGLAELARGVQKFNVTVEGTAAQSSSLAAIRSTDNWLETIIIADEGDSLANLTIGNRNTAYDGFDPLFTDGILGNFSLYQFLNNGGLISSVIEEFVDLKDPISWDLSSVKNNAVKDVLTFDASAFDNDTEVHAFFSDEVVDKYLNITDTDASDGDAPDATIDNVLGDAVWTFGEGTNIVNVNIAQVNMAVEGSLTREDFSFNVFTNGGDDLVQIQLGNGVGNCEGEEGIAPSIHSWYHNHLLNQNLYINTGSGNDKVEVWGSSAADIDLGSGDDVAFTDNSGVVPSLGGVLGVGEVYNDGRATWVFNTIGSNNIDNLASDLPTTALTNVANLQLRVSFQGVESVWVNVGDSIGSLTGETISDLDIVQAIKSAIAASVGAVPNQATISLGDLLVAEDGPARTLVVRSLIDGVHVETDLVIQLQTSSPLTAGQIANGATLYNAGGNLAALGILGFDGTGAQGGSGRFNSEFGVDVDSGYGTLQGEDSTNVNNNNVEGGLGNDLIVLSSESNSIETIDINSVFGEDVILNFTAGIAELIAEVQVLTFTGDDVEAGSATVTLNGVTYPPIAIPAGSSAEDIAALVGAQLDAADNGFDVVVSGATVSITATEAGVNYSPATVTFEETVPVGEVEVLIFSGALNGGETVTITTTNPDGTTNTAQDTAAVGEDLGLFLTDLAVALGLDADVNTTIASGPNPGEYTLTITNVNGGDVDTPAVVSIVTSGDNDIIVDRGEGTDGEDYLATVVGVANPDGSIVNSGGFDIFDVTTVLGGPVLNFFNDQPTLAPNSGDGLERLGIEEAVLVNGTVGIIDTVEPDDVPTANVNQTELQLIQQIATSEDTVGGAGTVSKSIVITVNDDNVGTFYLINDGAAIGDVQVTRLGSVELGQYGVTGKENIGNWDSMSLTNFTPLSAGQLAGSYSGLCDDIFISAPPFGGI